MRLPLIDKLEVRVPAEARYTPDMGEVLHWQPDLFRYSRFYLGIADLRPLGVDALLHQCARATRDHKVELLDTGAIGLGEMIARIEQIFAVDARSLEVMRIDLAADIQGVPVHAFKGNVRGKWKRSAREIGRYSMVGKLGVETFTLGKRPNIYRFYNKIAELQHQYALLKRRAKDNPVRSFADLYGYAEKGLIVTRIERQIGSNCVPKEIATVGKLVHLPDFDPFHRLQILVGSAKEPDPESMDFTAYLKGRGFREFVIEQGGLQNAVRLANKLSKGNGARFAKTFSNFLPSVENALTAEQIFLRYRESVLKQLAPAVPAREELSSRFC